MGRRRAPGFPGLPPVTFAGYCWRSPTLSIQASFDSRPHSDASTQVGAGNARLINGAKAEQWAPWLLAGLFLIFYASIAAPSIVAFFDDTLEFQLVLPTFGIAHPTGYPLYTILGGLWSRLLPVGEWAGRVNLFSALSAAVAVGLVAELAALLVRATWPATQGSQTRFTPAFWAAVTAALAFGLGPTWRSMATVAEVYALHGLFVALLLLLTLRAGRVAAERRNQAVLWLALVTGLSLAHHRTTVLLLPGIAIYLLWANPGLLRPQRAWLGWATALLLPLLLYAWLPLRYAMGVRDLNGAYEQSWTGFVDHLLARGYTAFFAETELAVERSAGDWVGMAVAEMGWLALALAATGLAAGMLRAAALRRRDSSFALRAWVLLATTLVANLLFALLYRVGDVEVFLLPVWLCAAVAAGAGSAWIVRLVARPAQRTVDVSALAGVALALLLLPAWVGRESGPNRRSDWTAHDAALAMSAPLFPPGSQVIGLEGEVTALRYMQEALDRAANASTIVADDPGQRRTLLEEALATGVPVWLTRELPGIEHSYSFTGEGALVRVWPRGEAAPAPPAQPMDLSFADGSLSLVGYELMELGDSDGRQLRVGLHWLPHTLLAQTLKLSLRVVDSAGTVLPLADGSPAQSDHFPLRLVAPTSTWLPGERVRDEQQIPLPRMVDDGFLLVILYDADTLSEAGRVTLPLP